MLFNDHSNLAGLHAFLSPSKYHWVNYTDEKIDHAFTAHQAARRGTDLHQLAQDLIRLGVKLPSNGKTLSLYVNDVLGYRMSPEIGLFYSENCFGTADAVGFRRNTLRIYDLKNGITQAKVHQLEVYAALFCLEYSFKPHDINMDLRIYQNDQVQMFETDPDVIVHIQDKIRTFDKRIKELRLEVES